VSARHWTPESRDALLTRVTALTAGTAVAGCVGALGLGAAFAATTHAKTVTHKAAGTSNTAPAVPATSPVTTPAKPVVAPAQVKVEVLNGMGIAGVAHAVAAQLTAAGFDVVSIGNAPGSPVNASGIIYSPDQAAAFRTLSKATGVTLSASSGTSSVLVLVVGPDWTGALPAAQSNQSGQGSSNNNYAQPPAAPQNGNGGGTTTSGGS
jgi:hypothetical protein